MAMIKNKFILRRAALLLVNTPCLRRIKFGNERILLPATNPSRLTESEPWMVETLRILTSEFDGGLLDIGVNLGQTLAAFKTLVPQRHYIGVEPNPDCVSYARKLARENEFSDVTIIPAALSAHSGLIKLDFYHDTEVDSSASIIPEFRPSQRVMRSEFIASLTGVELMKQVNLADISIVKIDVEGAEYQVLKELSSMLEKVRPIVTVEILPAYSEENETRLRSQRAIEKLITDIGYKIFRINHDETRLYGFEALDEFGIYAEIDKSDHILVPKECVAKFSSAVKIKSQSSNYVS